MLSDEQIDHYRTFGFLVPPGFLDERETAAIGVEMDRAHRDAFGARFEIDSRLAYLLEDLDDDDHAAYPPDDDHWLAPDPAQPERFALSRRMRELGMFQVLERA